MRRLVVLGSAKGTPGVTTTALALASVWPVAVDGGVRPVVVEAEAYGGDIATRFALAYTPGLLDVAASARRPQPGSLLGATQELPFGVRVVATPSGLGQCGEAVRILGDHPEALAGGEGEEGTVFVDVGRLGPHAEGLVEAADSMVLVARGGVDSLSHVFAHCDEQGTKAQLITLLVIGPCGYRAEEIASAVGVGRVMFLPWDAAAARILAGRSRGPLRRDGLRSHRLLRAAGKVAGRLTAQDAWMGEGLSKHLTQAGLRSLPPLRSGEMGELEKGEGGDGR
ncbi:hypothetical protein [Streptomyces sp. NPDC050738]|uniref:hypothetical protein n=1 Tax=Streptomyces sp. NPDC050738 TaxID=3154744 RepID=UPI00341B8A54